MLVHNVLEEPIPKEQDREKPQRPMEMPQEMISHKRRPYWDRDVVQGVEKYGLIEGRKRSRIYSSYVSLMCNRVDAVPMCFEEVTKKGMDGCITRRISFYHKE